MTVIGILALISALTLPTFTGMAAERSVDRAIGDLSSMLDQSRAYAMAYNTHVWVGLRQIAPSENRGSGIQIVAVTSNDGSGDPDPAKLVLLNKVYTCRDVAIVGTAEVPPEALDRPVQGVVALAGSVPALTFSYPLNGQGEAPPVSFEKVIEFGPLGEASIPDGRQQWIEIGLCARAGEVNITGNAAAIQVSGVTGQSRIFRQ